jgi:thiol-disulfide isomerase/thioredoxin
MMRKLLLAAVYTGFALGANAGSLDGLLTGDMKKLAVQEVPVDLPQAVLLDMADADQSLDAFKGKWVVLNFWATWCAPCRHEMPSLDRLQVALPEIAVVPLAAGRNAPEQITKFFKEAGVEHLTVLRDPKMELARAVGVVGLPVTLILNPEGQEVARLIGDAEWDTPEALAVFKALTAP